MDVLYDNHVKHPYKHLLLVHILIYHWLENMLTWYLSIKIDRFIDWLSDWLIDYRLTSNDRYHSYIRHQIIIKMCTEMGGINTDLCMEI